MEFILGGLSVILLLFPFLSILEYFIVKRYDKKIALIIPVASLFLIIIIPWYGIIITVINFTIYFLNTRT